MPQGFAGVRRIVDIPANTAPFLAILATTTSRRVVIDESQITSTGATNTPQGVIDYQLPNDGSANGFSTTFRITEGDEGIIGSASLPIVLGNPIAGHAEKGEIVGQVGQYIVGMPGGQPLPATTLIKLRSGTATGTSVVVSEYN